MANFDELFHGSDYAQRKEGLEKDLASIQEKHIEFFKSRKPLFPQDEYDMLHNHYLSKTSNGSFEFLFLNESDLPQYIRDECIAAVEKNFGKPKEGG